MTATTFRVLTLLSLCWSGLEQAISGEPHDRNQINLPAKEFSDDSKGGGQCIHSTGSLPKVSFSEVTKV